MNNYLKAILLFDVALPALILGLPCCALLWALLQFQSFAAEKVEEQAQYEAQSRQLTMLNAQLQPIRAKAELLKTLLSNDDIEHKLDRGLESGLARFSPNDVETTLHDFQFGVSTIGSNLGEGMRLTLKISSHWETLNTAAADWESRFPNLVLESLSINQAAGSASSPYLESALSYFVVTEN